MIVDMDARTVLFHAHRFIVRTRPSWRDDREGADASFDAACLLHEKYIEATAS